jgi:hypothetical protein
MLQNFASILPCIHSLHGNPSSVMLSVKHSLGSSGARSSPSLHDRMLFDLGFELCTCSKNTSKYSVVSVSRCSFVIAGDDPTSVPTSFCVYGPFKCCLRTKCCLRASASKCDSLGSITNKDCCHLPILVFRKSVLAC